MKLGPLEKSIGYSFKDAKLLERALTHRSWAFENLPGASDETIREIENESLEFFGDSVLGLVIAEKLFRGHPRATEGELTLMKHHLVSTKVLSSVAERIGVGEFLRVGRGEERSGGRKKQALLANTLEAVIAAVFLDSGYVPARAMIAKIFADELRSVTPTSSIDYKSMLQEKLQATRQSAPRYNVVRTDGPPHAREFHVEAVWVDGRSEGSGRSIKDAEMMAAAAALESIGETTGNAAA